MLWRLPVLGLLVRPAALSRRKGPAAAPNVGSCTFPASPRNLNLGATRPFNLPVSLSSDPEVQHMLSALHAAGGNSASLAGILLGCVWDGVAITDAAGTPIYLNAAAKRILGVSANGERLDLRKEGVELYYLNEFSPLSPDELPAVRAIRGQDVVDVELFVGSPSLADGALISMHARPLRQDDGRVVGAIVLFHDIGARKRAEEELHAANSKLAGWVTELERRASVSLLMNDMADLLQSCLTMDEFYAVVSRFAGKIFEHQPGCVFLVNPSRTAIEKVVRWGGSQPAERVFRSDACWALRRGRMHRAGGEKLGPDCGHVQAGAGGEYMCIPMMGQGEALGVLHVRQPVEQGPSLHAELQAMVVESRLRTTIAVTEHIALALANLRLRETLQTQAIRDPLTGLFNRRYMEESLARELARAERAGSSVSAIMLDLDHFKSFNDGFGHAAADLALRETCGLIRNLCRKDDIPCRFGGEEVVIILPDASTQSAVERAEALRSAIASQQLRYQGVPLGLVTASLGVASFPDHARNGEELLRAADEAMYDAKASGRDCVRAKSEPREVRGRGSVGSPTVRRLGSVPP